MTDPFRVVLGRAYSWFNWWVSFAPDFSIAISVSPQVCFILVLILRGAVVEWLEQLGYGAESRRIA